jgi:hypothetical protein
MAFRLLRRLSRNRNVQIIPDVDPSQATVWNNDDDDDDDDDSHDQDALAMPQIVVTQTQSTDEVETKLTSSFDGDEMIGETNEKINEFGEGNETKVVLLSDDNNRLGSVLDSLRYNPSRDSTAASGMTSVSQTTVTMDVHECNSIMCTLCKADAKKQPITFINVAPLDTNMINKLRTQPAKWYELGRSFDDLYREANRPDRRRRNKGEEEVDNMAVTDD